MDEAGQCPVCGKNKMQCLAERCKWRNNGTDVSELGASVMDKKPEELMK